MAFIKNTNLEDFGDVAGAAGITLSQFKLIFDVGGSNELDFGWLTLSNSRSLAQGDPIDMPIGDLSMELPAGTLTNAVAKAFMDDFLHRRGTAPTVRLGHSGAELTDTGYTAQTVEVAASLT